MEVKISKRVALQLNLAKTDVVCFGTTAIYSLLEVKYMDLTLHVGNYVITPASTLCEKSYANLQRAIKSPQLSVESTQQR
jgi:hypothetical protein